MKLKHFVAAAPAVLVAFGTTAFAGQSIKESGAIVCVADKWDEKEIEKGHKLADWVGRCVNVPDDPAAEKVTEECSVKYEFMPDETWKASGTCTRTHKNGDKTFDTVEEGSHLKAYPYKITGGTGKYKGATGGGTYIYENLTDTLSGGTYQGEMQLP